MVYYEGETMAELKQAFTDAVDDYLALCMDKDMEPEKAFKGSFNVRPGADRHKKIAVFAAKHGQSINEFMSAAIDHELQREVKY
jgi:predicted HicB family RNase H-like nuclease